MTTILLFLVLVWSPVAVGEWIARVRVYYDAQLPKEKERYRQREYNKQVRARALRIKRIRNKRFSEVE